MAFEYNDIKVDGIKLSPSGLAKFFSMPSVWYRDNILGEKSFEGNTATFLGSIVHEMADSVANNFIVSREDVEAFIDSITVEGVDKDVIRANWYDMSHMLINEYVNHNIPDLAEYQPKPVMVGDGIYLAGTLDGYYEHGVVLDYKTTSSKPKTDTIPWEYKTQLMSYAYMLKQEGKFVDRLRIVWCVKATKTLPVRIFEVNHEITEQDWKDFEDVLTLIVETLTLAKSNPEYIHLLFKSMSLQEK